MPRELYDRFSHEMEARYSPPGPRTKLCSFASKRGSRH